MSIAMIPMLLFSALLFFVVLLFLLCQHSDKNEKEISAAKKTTHKLFGQFKILLSFLQIFSSMPSVLDSVPWPTLFLQIAMPLRIFNLDVMSVLSETTCGVAVRFFDQFLLHMMLPVFCLVSIGMAYAFAHLRKSKDSSSRINRSTSKVVIVVILLLFPGLSTKIFSVFKCQHINGIKNELLVGDFSVSCHQGEHLTFTFIAVIFLVLYIVGIPLTMLLLLRCNKKHLHDEKSAKHQLVKNALGGLYMQCELFWLIFFFCNFLNLVLTLVFSSSFKNSQTNPTIGGSSS